MQPYHDVDPAELTPEQRITRALGRMPYLPCVTGYSTSAEPEQLARTLEGFAEELARIAHENQTRENAARELEQELSAAGRFIRRALEAAGA